MKRTILYIGILYTALGCTPEPLRLQSGDLLFMAGEKSEMTGAITAATGKEATLNFSHVGILCAASGADSVLEATTQGGVKMTSLKDFLAQAAITGGKPAVAALRLRDTSGVGTAIERAKTFLGQPYDYSFLPDNGRIYCSELVWESYRTADGAHRFTARPMNFCAADGTLPPYWAELFASQGEDVPQGVLGTNPNDLAKDPQLMEIYRWY